MTTPRREDVNTSEREFAEYALLKSIYTINYNSSNDDMVTKAALMTEIDTIESNNPTFKQRYIDEMS